MATIGAGTPRGAKTENAKNVLRIRRSGEQLGSDLDLVAVDLRLRPNELFVFAGKIFHDLSELSSMGIPTVALVFGNATAGGAYVPGMCDYAVLVDKQAKVFLGGPPLVKMATGEEANDEDLGGADMHSRISGVADHFAVDEVDCIRIGREIVSHINWRKLGPGPSVSADAPLYDQEEVSAFPTIVSHA